MNSTKPVLIILLVLAGILIVAAGGSRGALGVGTPAPTPWIDNIFSSTDPLGAEHIYMDNKYGPNCEQCHDGIGQDAPRSLVGVPYVDMGNGQQCTSCHTGKYIGQLFLSQMTTSGRFYSCSDCHQTTP